MSRAEEFLFMNKEANEKDLLALDKIRNDYPKLFRMICDKMESYHQSENKELKDEAKKVLITDNGQMAKEFLNKLLK